MGVSSTNNEWPQIEERMAVMLGGDRMGDYGNGQGLSATTATTRTAVEGANSIPAAGRVVTGTALSQQPLKCPRCESSNTKFCYYNNYSLSQPRHFCKACKRYWTRGGTLRNVPVGGGCRKNKRVRRSSSSSSITAAATTSTATARVSDPSLFPNLVSALSLPPSYSSCAIDPIFYGLHGNSTGIDFPAHYPSFLKKLDHTAGNNYDLINPNLNSNSNINLTSMGLCFPINAALPTHQDYMTTPPNDLQFHQTDSTFLFHDFSLHGTSSFTSSAAAASLIATKMSLNSTGWSANPSFDGRNIQAPVSSAAADLSRFDGVKEEDRNNGRLDWQIPCVDSDLFQNINSMEGNSLYWNVNPPPGIANGWPEPPAANHSVT